MDLSPLKDLANKIEADVLKDIAEALVPAVLKELVSLAPDQYKPLAMGLESVIEPILQQALDNVLAQVPKL